MPKQACDYLVISEITDKLVPYKLKIVFSHIQEEETISTESVFQKNKTYLLNTYKNELQSKINISSTMKKAHDQGLLKRIDDRFMPEWFTSLGTVSYWQSQLRGSRMKNPISENRSKDSTKAQYLYHLWTFQKWLSSRTFEINTLQADSQNTFIKKVEKKQFENVEELIKILDQPFADQKNIVRIIKQYLLDESHSNKKASYITIIKAAISSYFEKNEQTIQINFNPKTVYSTEMEMDQSLSLSELMEFLTTGKPSVTEKALFLCKFHRGLDVSTLSDRFNYEAWVQIVKWFGSTDYNSWDLEKCPVPISLTRVKTDFKHMGFLERDAVEQLQRYLEYRKKKTGQDMEVNQPLFLNKFKKPVSIEWIFRSFAKIATRAGIQKFVKINGRKQYKMDSHELRDLLKSTLIDSGCRIDVADHVIGHKPKDSYEKQSTLYPETLRKEYAKASKRLNIFTKFSNIVSGIDDADELRLELKEKLSELDNIKESRLDTEAEKIRNEKFALEQKRQMSELFNTVNELKKEIREKRQGGRTSLEFCCIDCEMVHCESQCPACGSKMRRIYEEKLSR